MKKKSSLETIVLPLIETINNNIDCSSWNWTSKSRFITSALRMMKGKSQAYDSSTRVTVRELSQTQYSQILKEYNSPSFSFNIKFVDCDKYKCCSWINKYRLPDDNRPTLIVLRGECFGFNVFTYKGVPVFGIMMYSKSFETWASRIGLKLSFNDKAANPSTHYVSKDTAIESGLLWVSPTVVSGVDLDVLKF